MARVTSQILSSELISFYFSLFHSLNPPAYISQTACLYLHLLFPSISSLSLPVFLSLLYIFLHSLHVFLPSLCLYFSTPTPPTPGFPPAPCIPPAPPRTFYQFLAPIVFSISTDNLEIGQIQENSSTTVSSADPGPLYSKLRSIPISILSQKGLDSTK